MSDLIPEPLEDFHKQAWGSLQAMFDSPMPIITGDCELMENFESSPQAFYALVEKMIAKRNIPDAKVKRVEHKQSGFFSAKREYLRISRERTHYEICAAPFGSGFFISVRMIQMPEGTTLLDRLFGRLMSMISNPDTYYRLDSQAMFKIAVDAALAEAKQAFYTGHQRRMPTLTGEAKHLPEPVAL
ncbi:MAG: hypothetical protein AAB288_08585 [Acidobacteriota bacterium]